MRRSLTTTLAILFSAGAALAQADQHEGHHPPESGAPQAQTAPAPSPSPAPSTTPAQTPGAAPSAGAPSSMPGGMPMMGSMPDQCRRAMQGMPQECMNMMRGMMQGGMMQGGMMGGMGGSQGAGMQAGSLPPHGMEMQNVMTKMDPPMMQAARIQDPDEAFVRGMIPHHQAAIDMAQIVLKHGKDEQAKKLAADVIREQTREIGEMQDWLKEHGK